MQICGTLEDREAFNKWCLDWQRNLNLEERSAFYAECSRPYNPEDDIKPLSELKNIQNTLKISKEGYTNSKRVGDPAMIDDYQKVIDWLKELEQAEKAIQNL